MASLETSRGGGKPYDVAAGESAVLKFKLTRQRLGQLRRDGRAALEFVATNSDARAGTESKVTVGIENGGAKKKRKHRRRR